MANEPRVLEPGLRLLNHNASYSLLSFSRLGLDYFSCHTILWTRQRSICSKVYSVSARCGGQGCKRCIAPRSYQPYSQIADCSKGLSKAERSWRETRAKEIIPELRDYLITADISDFDVANFIKRLNSSNVPIIGLSISGGGTQSGMGGLGVWQAFDARYQPAKQAHTGGLTQILSYLTGLSGGGAVTVSAMYDSLAWPL